MSFRNSIILGNYIIVVLISFFYLILFTNDTLEKKVIRKFKAIVTIFLILMCSDIVEYTCSTINTPLAINIRYVATVVGYFFRPCTLMYAITVFWKDKKSKYLLFHIPLIINIVCLIINIFYPLMFRYDGTKFVRKSFGYIPHMVSATYLIIMLIVIIKCFRIVGKNEQIMLVFTGVAIVGAVAIETILGLYFILNAVSIASTIFYFIYLYSNVSKRDDLTGLFNRKTLFNGIKQYLNDSFVVVSIDMNNLKLINDTLGHLEGDKALKVISKVFLKNLKPKCSAYRVGGDEFIIICPKYEINEIETMMENISSEVVKKGYSIAYGLALYEKDKDLDEVIKMSDDLMYMKKREMKKENVY